MPPPAISHRRHSVLALSVHDCILKIVNIISFKPLVGFHQIYNLGAVGDKEELIIFLGQGQCQSKHFEKKFLTYLWNVYPKALKYFYP